MGSGNQRMEPIQNFSSNRLFDENIRSLGNGMPEIRAKRKKQTDSIRGTGRDNNELAEVMRPARQGQNVIERARDLWAKVRQQIGTIRGDLRRRIDRQCPEAVAIPIRLPRGSNRIGGHLKLFRSAKERC